MSQPTPVVRAVTYERDDERCVSCGTRIHKEYQHRLTVGMGGSKRRPRFEEGVTSCAICNPEYERSLQIVALVYGWKVRKIKRAIEHPEDVPVFYLHERTWYELTTRGTRIRITTADAARRMREVYGPQWDEWVVAAGEGLLPGSIANETSAAFGRW